MYTVVILLSYYGIFPFKKSFVCNILAILLCIILGIYIRV